MSDEPEPREPQPPAPADMNTQGGAGAPGDSIDAQGSQGFVNRPRGPVYQTFVQAPSAEAERRRYLAGILTPAEAAAAQAQLASLPLQTIPAHGDLPAGSWMPLGANANFVGRDAELIALAATLTQGETAAIGPLAAATGMGGIGKTQLACEFVHRYGRYFAGGVLWLSFADGAAVAAELLLFSAWPERPPWGQALRRVPQIKEFLRGQTLVAALEKRLGAAFWEPYQTMAVDQQSIYGVRTLAGLSGRRRRNVALADAVARVKDLRSYCTPVEEKYARLFAWWRLRQQGQTARAAALHNKLLAAGLGGELAALQSVLPGARIVAIPGDVIYCPECHMALSRKTLHALQQGTLQTCELCRRVLLYRKP